MRRGRRGAGRRYLSGGAPTSPRWRLLIWGGRGRARRLWLRRVLSLHGLRGLEDATPRLVTGTGGGGTIVARLSLPVGGGLLILPEGGGWPFVWRRLRAAERERRSSARVAVTAEVDPWCSAVRALGPYTAREAVAYALLYGEHGAHADHEGDRSCYEAFDQDGAAREGRQV